MHGTIMVFFFISYVLVSGFGNYLVPLQVGARDMAFPFLNMLSYWIGLASALVLLCSFFVEGGAAAAGWTAYPPLSAVAAAVPGSQMGQTVWLISMALFIAVASPEGQHMVAAFREGILFLLAAPFVVFGTVATIAVRKFRQR
jgi:cytochrome c oxidase subunit I